jgi:DNA repair exonuclease SbcCD nuclease subunit
VHGQGFARREVTDDLASAYPSPVPGLFNVGLLHTCLDGREGHDPYAPCSLRTLVDKGYDYWALGHVHAREVVHQVPWVVYPGNLQGRHARETGAKGATLITVEDGRVAAVVHRPLDVVRWALVTVDASDAASPDDVVDLVRARLEDAVADADGRMVAARLLVTGATAAHDELSCDVEKWEAQIRGAAIDVGLDAVWLEKVRLATTASFDLAELRDRDDAIGQLARSLVDLRDDDGGLEALLAELAELDAKLPREAKEGPDALRLGDPAFAREILADVEHTLLPMLLAKGDGA